MEYMKIYINSRLTFPSVKEEGSEILDTVNESDLSVSNEVEYLRKTHASKLNNLNYDFETNDAEEVKHDSLPTDKKVDGKIPQDVRNLKTLLKILYDCKVPEPHESLSNVWEVAAVENKVFSYFINKKNNILHTDPEEFLEHIKDEVFVLISNVLQKKWVVKINFTIHCDYWLLDTETAPIAKSKYSFIVCKEDNLVSLLKYVGDYFKEELNTDTLKLKEIKWLSMNFSEKYPNDNKFVRLVVN